MEKRGKGKIFTVLGRKNIIFFKRVWGKHILFWANIYPWIHIPVEDWFVSDELVDGAGLEYVQGGHQLNAAVSAASLANR